MQSFVAFAITAAYVALEFCFNLLLVDAAASLSAQRAAALEWLEPAGRLLGGLGCTLLLARALRRFAYGRLAAAAVSFPLMWFGQQALLDALADASSPQERRHAYAAMLLSDSVRNGRVSMSGLEASGPHGVMLAAVFPLLADQTDLSDAVLRQLRPLVEASVAADCTRTGCICTAQAGQRLPSARDIERCAVEPLMRAQQANYQGFLNAHRKLAGACAGDLRDAASCRLQREALEARLGAGPLDPAEPISRSAFDRRTDFAQRAAAQLLQRFGLREDSVPEVCRKGLLAPAQHAQSCVYEPLLDRFVEQARGTMLMAVGDAEAAASARQAYRSMIALPMALGFSLFFGLVNAAGLLARAVVASLQLIAPVSVGTAGAVQMLAVVAALLCPAWLSADTETGAAERQALVARILDDRPPTALKRTLMWVLQTEPVVYRGLRGSIHPGQRAFSPPAPLSESLIFLHETLRLP